MKWLEFGNPNRHKKTPLTIWVSGSIGVIFHRQSDSRKREQLLQTKKRECKYYITKFLRRVVKCLHSPCTVSSSTVLFCWEPSHWNVEYIYRKWCRVLPHNRTAFTEPTDVGSTEFYFCTNKLNYSYRIDK